MSGMARGVRNDGHPQLAEESRAPVARMLGGETFSVRFPGGFCPVAFGDPRESGVEWFLWVKMLVPKHPERLKPTHWFQPFDLSIKSFRSHYRMSDIDKISSDFADSSPRRRSPSSLRRRSPSPRRAGPAGESSPSPAGLALRNCSKVDNCRNMHIGRAMDASTARWVGSWGFHSCELQLSSM